MDHRVEVGVAPPLLQLITTPQILFPISATLIAFGFRGVNCQKNASTRGHNNNGSHELEDETSTGHDEILMLLK